MNLLGAKINEAPDGLRDGLRALINVGSFVKSVLDHADGNARAKVEMGQEPDLLEDVMKGGKVHIPQLEELVAEFAAARCAAGSAAVVNSGRPRSRATGSWWKRWGPSCTTSGSTSPGFKRQCRDRSQRGGSSSSEIPTPASTRVSPAPTAAAMSASISTGAPSAP